MCWRTWEPREPRVRWHAGAPKVHQGHIKDVDNPFDFKEGARDQSSGEVALFPLDEYRERLAARVGQSSQGRHA